MFLDQFLAVKNMPKKTREFLLMLLFSCTMLMHIACNSCACDLYDSSALLYTQDLSPDDSCLCLGIEMVEILRVKARVFYFD